MRIFKRGFTLMEVLMVIFIIGVLASWAIANFAPANLQAEDQAAQTQLRIIYAAANSFRVENGTYPVSIDDLVLKGHIQDLRKDGIYRAGNWKYGLSGSSSSVAVAATGISGAPAAKGRIWQISATDGTITSINFQY